jgi:transcriptional regulator with XRE-family HTH domain
MIETYLNGREKLAQDLRGIRKSLGLTQEQLAFEIEYDQSSLSKIELGKSKLQEYLYNRLLVLLEELEVDISRYKEIE